MSLLQGAADVVPAEAFDFGGVLLVLRVQFDDEVVASEDDGGQERALRSIRPSDMIASTGWDRTQTDCPWREPHGCLPVMGGSAEPAPMPEQGRVHDEQSGLPRLPREDLR